MSGQNWKYSATEKQNFIIAADEVKTEAELAAEEKPARARRTTKKRKKYKCEMIE